MRYQGKKVNITVTELTRLNEAHRRSIESADSIDSLLFSYQGCESQEQKPKNSKWLILLGCFASLGSIYGDISTSPLYTFNNLFDNPSQLEVIGAMSILFWLFTLMVMVKYVLVVISYGSYRDGGGQIAIYSKIVNHLENKSVYDVNDSDEWIRTISKTVCFIGCSLVISDGLLTPTTSILNATSGISLPFPTFDHQLALSVFILFCVFSIQRFGADKLSFLFAPVILLWLVNLGIIGAINIAKCPVILKAVNPWYGYLYLKNHGLGGVSAFTLAITGTEAIFLDLGYIEMFPVQLTVCGLVYPCLMMNYFGQCSYVILNPVSTPNTDSSFVGVFYSSIPGGANSSYYWIVFILATLSTIIASQALILGVFTVIHQLVELEFLPRLDIIHLSSEHKQMVFIPAVNFFLMVGLLVTMLIFQNPQDITMAYGLGISLDFLITSVLTLLVLTLVYKRLLGLTLLVFIPIEIVMVIANYQTLYKGGWFVVIISALFTSFLFFYDKST